MFRSIFFKVVVENFLVIWLLASTPCIVTQLTEGKALRQIDPVLALLPWTPQDIPDQRVFFTLSAYGGCFVWTSQRPDFVSVEPLYEPMSKCSMKAVISPTTSSFKGGKSWVFARDVVSGEELRCEVHVAPIANISIDTSAKSISVDTVETVTIRATDDRGNVFSSLEGLWFSWSSTRKGLWLTFSNYADLNRLLTDVLSFSSLDSDVYHASKKRQDIERLGGQTDLVLLKGVSTGSSRVSSRLVSSAYKHVPEATINLDVSEPLMIEPPYLHTIPYARFSYSLRSLKPQSPLLKSLLIDLPSPYFLWSSVSGSNTVSSCVNIDSTRASAVVNAIETFCETKVVVTDRRLSNIVVGEAVLLVSHLKHLKFIYTQNVVNLKTHEAWKMFETSMSRPSSPNPYFPVSMSLQTKETWYFVRGLVYLIGLYGLNQNDQQLYLPMNLKIQVKCGVQKGDDSSSEALKGVGSSCLGLKVLQYSPSWQYILVEATDSCQGFLVAEVRSDGQASSPNAALKETLQVRQSFQITHPITVTFGDVLPLSNSVWPDNLLALPFHHQWSFNAHGGSGFYVWSSSNTSVVKIISNIHGSVFVETENISGYSIITVADRHNALNYQSFTLVVSPLHYMTMDPLHKKEPLGQSIEILLRAIPQVVDCGDQPCPSNIEVWNKKLNSIQQVKHSPVLTGDSFNNDLDRFNVHFVNCSSIRKVLKEDFQIIVETVETKESLSWNFVETSSDPFVCGRVIVSSPNEPTCIAAETILNNGRRTTTYIEVFSPLSWAVGVPDHPWNLLDPILDPSALIQSRLNISVGSWVSFKIQGGPSGSVDSKISTHAFFAPEISSHQARVNGVSDTSNHFDLLCLDAVHGSVGSLTIMRQAEPLDVAVNHGNTRHDRSISRDDLNRTMMSSRPWGVKVPYEFSTITSTADVKFTCVYPSRIDIQPYRFSKIPQIKRPIQEVFPSSHNSEKGMIRIGYTQCNMEHQLGLFVYSADDVLITFWSSAYRPVWVLNNTVSESNNLSLQNVTLVSEKCYGALDVKVFLRFDVTFWENFLFKLLGSSTGLRETGKRILKSFVTRKVGSQYVSELADRLGLIPIPPLEVIPSSTKPSMRPFFYDPQCLRRFQVRFGSGRYRVHLSHEKKLIIKPGRALIRSQEKPFSFLGPSDENHNERDESDKVASFYNSMSNDVGNNYARESAVMDLHNSSFVKYYDSIDFVHVPFGVPKTSLRCPGYNNLEFDPLFSPQEDTQDFKKIRQVLKGPDEFQFKSPQSLWDVYLKPRLEEPPFSFSITVVDQYLLGVSKIKLSYCFSYLGKLHITFGQFTYSFQGAMDDAQEPYSLPDSRRDSTNVDDVFHVDVNDVVELHVDAFDSVYNLKFQPEEIQLMRVCLTDTTSQQSDVQMSCVGDYSLRTGDLRPEDIFWNLVLESQRKISSTHITMSSMESSMKSKPRLFFQPRKKGVYTLQAAGHNVRGSPILSNILRVVVSDPLMLFPSSLVLLPGYHTYEMVTKGERDGQPKEKYMKISVMKGKYSTNSNASDIVSLEWIKNTSEHQQWDSASFSSILEVTTGRSCGQVKVFAFEKDKVSSRIRGVSANIIVAIPDVLRINADDLSTESKILIPFIKLHASNFYTLKALFTLQDGTPFTQEHHWLSSAVNTNKSGPKMEGYGCHYTWSSNRPDVLQFIKENDVSYTPKQGQHPFRTGLGLHDVQGFGLYLVRIKASPSVHDKQVTCFVKVVCVCEFPYYEAKSKNPSAISRQYEAQIQVEIMPEIHTLAQPVFSDCLMHQSLSDPFINGFHNTIQILRLVSFGEYHFKLPEGFVGVEVQIIPSSNTYRFIDVSFLPETDMVNIKVLVESLEKHKAFLYLKRHKDWSNQDSIVVIDVFRPGALSAFPANAYTSLGSRVRFHPILQDETGFPLLFPSNMQLFSYVSHASVLRQEEIEHNTESSFNSPVMEGVASRLGCTGITFDVVHPNLKTKKSRHFSSGARICVITSVYPSAPVVLCGAHLHPVIHFSLPLTQPVQPQFQLRILLKSTIVAWAWLAYGSSSCISELESFFIEDDWNSPKIHSVLHKWIYYKQPFFTDISCRKVSSDVIKGWIRQRLDTLVSSIIQKHMDGHMRKNSELVVLSDMSQNDARRSTASGLLDHAMFSYTLTITSYNEIQSPLYLEWMVSKISHLFEDFVLVSQDDQNGSIHDLRSHITWQEGGVVFLNSETESQKVEWSLNRKVPLSDTSLTSVAHPKLGRSRAELSTSEISGAFVATLKKSDQEVLGELQLNVVSKVESICVLLRHNITDIQPFNIAEEFPNENNLVQYEDLRCSNADARVTYFSKTLLLQKTPLDAVILPYAGHHPNSKELLVSSPFVSQKLTVTCDSHGSPFFDVIPVYGIPVSQFTIPYVATVGCRLIPRLSSMVTTESHFSLGVKLQGATSLASTFEFRWPLGWNLVIQPDPNFFVLFTKLPFALQDFISRILKKDTGSPFYAIQMSSNSLQPIVFRVLTTGQCLVETTLDTSKTWKVQTVVNSPNVTEVKLFPLPHKEQNLELPEFYAQWKSTFGSSITQDYSDITLLTIQCGIYVAQLPLVIRKSLSKRIVWTHLVQKFSHFTSFLSQFLLKLVFSSVLIIIATWVYYTKRTSSSFPRRSNLELSTLAQRSTLNTGTPYRQQWSNNRGIGIGGYSAQSPTSACASTARRSLDLFT